MAFAMKLNVKLFHVNLNFEKFFKGLKIKFNANFLKIKEPSS